LAGERGGSEVTSIENHQGKEKEEEWFFPPKKRGSPLQKKQLGNKRGGGVEFKRERKGLCLYGGKVKGADKKKLTKK